LSRWSAAAGSKGFENLARRFVDEATGEVVSIDRNEA
jgi:hypothetical protein